MLYYENYFNVQYEYSGDCLTQLSAVFHLSHTHSVSTLEGTSSTFWHLGLWPITRCNIQIYLFRIIKQTYALLCSSNVNIITVLRAGTS